MSKNKKLIQLWSNNEKRQAFLKSYQDWSLWLTLSEADLVFYRYQMPDGTNIIAMEHKTRDYSDYRAVETKWTNGVRYYVQKAGEPFTPGSHTSIWLVADLLKKAKTSLQKEAKDQEES